MASIKEQVEALLCEHVAELACRELGVRSMESRSYAEVFTVSRDQVVEYVLEHGLPPEVNVHHEASPEDGVYLIRHLLSWEVYHQERGGKYLEQTLRSRKGALTALVDSLLYMSGTGKDLERQGIGGFPGKLIRTSRK